MSNLKGEKDLVNKTASNLKRTLSEIISENNISRKIKKLRSEYVVIQGNTKKAFVIKPSKHQKDSLIWRLIKSGLQSVCFEVLAVSTKESYARSTISFLKWLSSQTQDTVESEWILSNYSVYVCEEKGHKNNSAAMDIKNIIILIDESCEKNFNNVEKLKSLRINERIRRIESRGVYDSLCDWFLKVDWLREEMVENQFLKLESPRVLRNSLLTCLSTLLNELAQYNTHILNVKIPTKVEIEADKVGVPMYPGAPIAIHKKNHRNWFIPVLQKIDDESLTSFMMVCWYGRGAPHALDYFKQKGQIGERFIYENMTYYMSTPTAFTRYNLYVPTVLEQTMIAWIMASYAMQPSDIIKANINNMVVEKTPRGKYSHMQFCYKKGRAGGSSKESEVINANSAIGRALLTYRKRILIAQEYLSPEDKGYLVPFLRHNKSKYKFTLPNGPATSFIGLLRHWFAQPVLRKKMYAAHEQQKTSRCFYDALSAIFGAQEAIIYSQICNGKKPIKSLPTDCFTLTHLKQLAVFGRHDKYRVNDLVNYNSHTSETERISYLTDKNKEWVNRHGRIIRVIIDDLEKNVFMPNLELINKKVNEKKLRTEVVTALDAGLSEEDIIINNISAETFLQYTNTQVKDPYNFIVMDHPLTVVYMIHFLNETEKNVTALSFKSPEFLEKTVAPKCQWIEWVMAYKLNARNVTEGRKIYKKIKEHLPALFVLQLREE